jgi:hypothetical protein
LEFAVVNFSLVLDRSLLTNATVNDRTYPIWWRPASVLAFKKKVNHSVYVQPWGGLQHLIMLDKVSIRWQEKDAGATKWDGCKCSPPLLTLALTTLTELCSAARRLD